MNLEPTKVYLVQLKKSRLWSKRVKHAISFDFHASYLQPAASPLPVIFSSYSFEVACFYLTWLRLRSGFKPLRRAWSRYYCIHLNGVEYGRRCLLWFLTRSNKNFFLGDNDWKNLNNEVLLNFIPTRSKEKITLIISSRAVTCATAPCASIE